MTETERSTEYSISDRKEWDRFERRNYLVGYIKYRRTQISERMFGHEYWPLPKYEAGKKLLSIEKTNTLIADMILSENPFWVGRFGGTEMNAIYSFLKHKYHPENDNRVDAVSRLCQLSGFFPNDIQMGERFVDLMLECCSDIDLQAAWGRYMGDYVYKKYQPDTLLTGLDRIEPWNAYKSAKGVRPWSHALKGKRVLVVHPFSESIEQQYKKNRKHIFERVYCPDDILPEFDLTTIKAVQTLADEKDPRFSTWFDALEWMKDECSKRDFDVAIVGCGAYGYPLAAEIKKMGKGAIHLAGATQLLFGVIGKRWETDYTYRDFANKIPNEFWVRPGETEFIAGKDRVESACYW